MPDLGPLPTVLILLSAGLALSGAGLVWAVLRLGRLKAEIDRHLGRLATRLNVDETFADNEFDRIETRLLELEKARMDAEAEHSNLANAVGNETFAVRAAIEGLWKAVRHVADPDGECSGKGGCGPLIVGDLVPVRGGKAVEFVAGSEGMN